MVVQHWSLLFQGSAFAQVHIGGSRDDKIKHGDLAGLLGLAVEVSEPCLRAPFYGALSVVARSTSDTRPTPLLTAHLSRPLCFLRRPWRRHAC
jgi:hypothetical protein